MTEEDKVKEQKLNDNLGGSDEEIKKMEKMAAFKFILIIAIAISAIAVIVLLIIIFAGLNKGEENKGKEKKNGTDVSGKIIEGTYSINIIAADYGCGVDKVILSLEEVLDKVSKDTFTVIECKKSASPLDEEHREIVSNRNITNVYFCDEKGTKIDNPSKYITIKLNTDPNEGSPLCYSSGFNTWYDPYYLNIKLSSNAKVTSNGNEVNSIKIDYTYTSRVSPSDKFKKVKTTYLDVEYNYAIYTPQEKSDKLFVWLNGYGEGGSLDLGETTDADVVLLGNKVTALADEKFQNTLGGCNVLAPQAPTMWMDNGKEGTHGGKDSIYLKSLIALIDDYISKNDIKKVIIGGCSNGGYMTMLIAMVYGNKYQGYIPICEAMKDEYIDDDEIEKLKDLPIFFIYSKDDGTVVPDKYEIPTLKRLKEAGAENVHVSTSEHVIDTSGKYKDKDGNPYQYNGHLSWVYFFNGESKCDECEKPIFEWIDEVIKENE